MSGGTLYNSSNIVKPNGLPAPLFHQQRYKVVLRGICFDCRKTRCPDRSSLLWGLLCRRDICALRSSRQDVWFSCHDYGCICRDRRRSCTWFVCHGARFRCCHWSVACHDMRLAGQDLRFICHDMSTCHHKRLAGYSTCHDMRLVGQGVRFLRHDPRLCCQHLRFRCSKAGFGSRYSRCSCLHCFIIC